MTHLSQGPRRVDARTVSTHASNTRRRGRDHAGADTVEARAQT